MKRGKSFGAFSLLIVTALLMTACGNSGPTYVLPTLAPQSTPTPVVEGTNGPSPTVAPDAKNIKIIALDGEQYNQTSNFTSRGTCSISVKPIAYTGEFSFCISERDSDTSCMYLNFSDTEGNVKNVSGRLVHIATWVYHESGIPADFACRLQGKKPDGTSDTPESITLTGVPSGTWTLLEGDIPVYANLSSPTISVEMTSSKEPYYFDDIRLTYDPNSSIPVNTAYSSSAFQNVFSDFEDQKSAFANRGDAQSEVVSGGYNESGYCLFVSKRTADWNGVQIDLSGYGLAGSDVWVSFAAKHNAKQKSRVICSLQWTAVGSATEKYSNITTTDTVMPGLWSEGKGSIRIPNNAETVVIYFESEATNDFYLDDIIISNQDPSTLNPGDNPGNPGGATDNPNPEDIDPSDYEIIHSLSAKDEIETQIFTSRGSAQLAIRKKGYSGSCFEITGRTQAWNGVGLDFTNLENQSFDVIGKQLYVSCWVYQDSGEPMDFSATLQVNKPDGSSAWPERVSVEAVPSGKWTHIEGVIPVYANIKVPQINFELPGSDTADFLLDEIVIGYDPDSSVEANADYEEAAKIPFSPISLSFEDNNAFFEARGNGKPSLVYGGHESDMCLAVTGRTSNWHGVQADLSKYDLAGKTLDISFWIYHEYTTPLQVKMTAEQNDGENTTYTPAVVGEEMPDGKWIQFTNTYAVPENAKKFVLYFESPVEDADFFIDDVSIKLQ